MPTMPASTWTHFAEAIFRAVHVPADEAKRVAESLVDANLCGHDSHGLIRVLQYVDAIRDGRIKPGAPFKVVKETAAVMVVDGGMGLGQVQAHRLLDRLVPRAQALGLAAGTLMHSGHIGRLGEYAEKAAAQNMAFMATVNNHGGGRGVAPPGGKEGRIGTNPLCLGAPTRSDPVFLDIGTSVVAEGKVRVLHNKGERTPPGWLLDADGKPTTDPSVMYKEPRGTILPLGGDQAYKGFGLGLLVDIFSSGLSGAPCSAPGLPNLSANAVFFLVLDIAQFAGTEHFLTETTKLAGNIKNCPRAEGVKEILLPGEPERRAKAQRLQNGISVDEGTWGQLTMLADKVSVAIPYV